jgi:hypothetical protein
MAKKFGLFTAGHARTLNQFDGDEMEQNGEYVYIFNYETPGDRNGRRTQVAAIRLDKGQHVKDITGTPLARP